LENTVPKDVDTTGLERIGRFGPKGRITEREKNPWQKREEAAFEKINHLAIAVGRKTETRPLQRAKSTAAEKFQKYHDTVRGTTSLKHKTKRVNSKKMLRRDI
jgi:hypothetical protein